MSEQRTAAAALRLWVAGLQRSGAIVASEYENALEMVEVLYAPFQKKELYAVVEPKSPLPPSLVPTPTPQPISLPLSKPGPYIDPAWRPVLHEHGSNPCHKPAYYLVNKISRHRIPKLDVMRMIPTGAPPRVGVDPQICGSCGQEINPFSPADLDFFPHFLTDQEEINLKRQTVQVPPPEPETIPIDPALEAANAASMRWVPAEGSQLDHLIGIARTLVHPDDITLPENADAGLPPDSPLPDLPVDISPDFDLEVITPESERKPEPVAE